MHKILAAIFLPVFFLIMVCDVRPEENLFSAYVYPSAEYDPLCMEFCRKHGIKEVILNWKTIAAGRSYKESGFSVVSGWVPYSSPIWTLPDDEMVREIATWGREHLGPDTVRDIDGFTIDEPSWGLGDWKNQRIPELETDIALRKGYYDRFGSMPVLSRDRNRDPEGWRKTLWFRERTMTDRLARVVVNYGKVFPGKSMHVNISPTMYESGAQMGADIHFFKNLPENCFLETDPYFQAFRRPLQWSGFMIRWFRTAMDERPLGGVIEFYDSHLDTGWPPEGYMDLEPDDVLRQPFEYLMHGAVGIKVFVMCPSTHNRKENLEALGQGIDFAEHTKDLWQDTVPLSQVGVYFSNNTFRMRDMWGPWSRMTGLYGASFQTEYTYYTLSYLHIPADIVSMAFNEERGLLEKLNRYPVVILPDVKCVSRYEADCFRRYVERGGTLIATGETSFYDENGNRRSEPAFKPFFGADITRKSKHVSMKIVKNDFIESRGMTTIATEEGAAGLFRRQADRHPQWLKEKCKQMMFDGYDLKFSEKLPEPSSWSVRPEKNTTVLAVYEDNSVSAISRRYGSGNFIYIAPDDLTLFRGEVTDCLETVSGEMAGGMKFLGAIIGKALDGKEHLMVEAPPTVEIALRRKKDGNERTVYLLNHKKEIVPEIKLKLSAESGEFHEVSLLRPGGKNEILPYTVSVIQGKRIASFTISDLENCGIVRIR